MSLSWIWIQASDIGYGTNAVEVSEIYGFHCWNRRRLQLFRSHCIHWEFHIEHGNYCSRIQVQCTCKKTSNTTGNHHVVPVVIPWTSDFSTISFIRSLFSNRQHQKWQNGCRINSQLWNLNPKLMVWKMDFLLGWPNFQGRMVSFREGFHLPTFKLLIQKSRFIMGNQGY